MLEKLRDLNHRSVADIATSVGIVGLIAALAEASLPKGSSYAAIAQVVLTAAIFGLGPLMLWSVVLMHRSTHAQEERAPAWRLTLLIIGLLVALSLPFWIGRFF